MVTCNEPTEHYSSGRALLLDWDIIIRDKTLSKDEMLDAIGAFIRCETGGACPKPLSLEEINFIIQCHEDYNGDINAMCPPSMPTSFWIFLLVVAIIIMYILGGEK